MASSARQPQQQQRQRQQQWSWCCGGGRSDAAADWPREPSRNEDGATTGEGRRSDVVNNGIDGDNGYGEGDDGDVVD